MRCWALAEEFAGRGASVSWYSAIEIPWVRSALKEVGWPVVEPVGTPSNQASEIEADLVIVDSYTLEPMFREVLLDRGIPVLAIVDDSHSEAGPASLWVNPGVWSHLSVPESGLLLNGPDFVLLRQEVRRLRSLRESRLGKGDCPSGLTFLLGGSDASGLGASVRELPGRLGATGGLFAGPGGSGSPGGVSWLAGGPGLLIRAALSELVVSAAGVSSWEMAHVGVPLALVQVAENQRGNYDWMTSEGWACPLGSAGELRDPQALADRVEMALKELREGRLAGTSRIDGLGAQRVVDVAMDIVDGKL